jgi:hypothetical protein
MAKFYITYGNGTKQRHCYSIIERDSYTEARDYLFRAIGNAWAFLYTEDEWCPKNQDEPQTQAERFGLTEIPLQAHEKY